MPRREGNERLSRERTESDAAGQRVERQAALVDLACTGRAEDRGGDDASCGLGACL